MEAFIGEIRAFPYSFAPQGWFDCNGASLSIQTYPALYALLGTRFGGDGQSTFRLPDLRGFAVLGTGTTGATGSYTLGQTVGSTAVTLTQQQLPSHTHSFQTQGGLSRLAAPSSAGLPLTPSYTPSGSTRSFGLQTYVPATSNPALVPMSGQSLAVAGGGQSHENRSPFLILRWCICWDGLFPDLQ